MDDESLPMLDPYLDDIQWPSDFSGQQLFIQGMEWQYNSMLNWSHFRADPLIRTKVCISQGRSTTALFDQAFLPGKRWFFWLPQDP